MPSLVSTRNLVLLPLLTLAVLLGLAALGPVSDADAASKQRVSRAAKVALQQIGDRYRYGAAGPGAFDCSGLMQYSYRKAGIKHPAHLLGPGPARPPDPQEASCVVAT